MKASYILQEGLRIKEKIIEEAKGVTRIRVDEMGKNEHATRPPRPCGLTIHPAYGCTLGCVYCYVDPMERLRIMPSRLSGYELVVALSLNPYFLPGPYGTLIAFGSITECFLNQEVTSKTLEYMHWINKKLGNPQQVSTKMTLSQTVISRLRERGDPNLSVLISLTNLNYYRLLEPRAPSPLERIMTGKLLLLSGFKVAIFLRPVLPGVTDVEFESILNESLNNNLNEIVIGSLLLNINILKRIEKLGLKELREEVEKRLQGDLKKKLVPINSWDLKLRLKKIAIDKGFIVHQAACSANVYAHHLSCWMCKFGPCGDKSNLPIVDDVEELFEIVGLKVKFVKITDDEVIYIRPLSRVDSKTRHLIMEATKRRIILMD